MALDQVVVTQARPRGHPEGRYRKPAFTNTIALHILLERIGRGALDARQLDMLRSPRQSAADKDIALHYVGDLGILKGPAVSVIGTRDVSAEGRSRAYRLAREMAEAGVTVVSGLAKGVDTAAHSGALKGDGRTVAVIGTPLTKAYPAENARLQEEIYTEHLLLSPFAEGESVFKSNFPKRNRVMAAVTDGSVIIEASDTSGTLHQAAECQRLGRWLFILKSVVDDPNITWPRSFVGQPKTRVVECTNDVLTAIQ